MRTAINFTKGHLSKPVGGGWLATVRACEDGDVTIPQIQSHKKQDECEYESRRLRTDSTRYKWQRSEENRSPEWPPDPSRRTTKRTAPPLPLSNYRLVIRCSLNHRCLLSDPLMAFANVRYEDLNSMIPGANAVTAESPYRGLCSRHSRATVVAAISLPIRCLRVIYTV